MEQSASSGGGEPSRREPLADVFNSFAASGIDILSDDIEVPSDSDTLKVWIAAGSSTTVSVVEKRSDEHATYTLNSGQKLPAGSLLSFPVVARTASAYNLQLGTDSRILTLKINLVPGSMS